MTAPTIGAIVHFRLKADVEYPAVITGIHSNGLVDLSVSADGKKVSMCGVHLVQDEDNNPIELPCAVWPKIEAASEKTPRKTPRPRKAKKK